MTSTRSNISVESKPSGCLSSHQSPFRPKLWVVALVLSLPSMALAQEGPAGVSLPGLESAARGSKSGSASLPGETHQGRILIEELRCAACHEGLPERITPVQPGPDLSEVGWRIAPGYLERYINDPSAQHPGTKMPGLLESRSVDQRAEISKAITHFLVSRSPRAFSSSEADPELLARGERLYHEAGCLACHSARRSPAQSVEDPIRIPGAVDLAHIPEKYSLDSLADFLYQPLRIRPAGRMPDMGLSRLESREIASYLLGEEAPSRSALEVQPSLAKAGEQHFRELNCGACHEAQNISSGRAAMHVILHPEQGCLAEDDSETPRYTLNSTQREAMLKVLQSPLEPLVGEPKIASLLATFNCTACHERNGYGGVSTALAAYFETDEPNLGDHARIPPRLTLAGAKLQPEWMRKVLFNGAAVRPYMHTRMPQFGEENLSHLPELLAEADRMEPFSMPSYEGDAASEVKDGGRELLGTRGLACVSCHNFNGRLSPNMKGLDLIDSCDRLQPAWFAAFLVDPEKYRPGILMPQSWPGGDAAHTTILGGDTEAQIRAIWFYLAAGRTARLPEGLEARPSKLEVIDRTRTYRGRSAIAGFRGIAVGFPDGVNYAFDANNGALSGIWVGDYISVRWDGQGAGDFTPAARAIQLARDVSFLPRENDEQPWPLRPRTTEEQPINPDPAYPRNWGYQFRGYYYDESDVPTFMYESGTIGIEDRSIGVVKEERTLLRRTLRFEAPTAQALWFRPLVGDLERASPTQYKQGSLQLTTPDARTLMRPTLWDPTQSELLIELDLPAGTSEWSFEYEINS